MVEDLRTRMSKVSVIIPTHNRSRFVCDAIDSVLSQTHRDLEAIVVDDGSTDGTQKLLSKYGDKIHYIRQDNRGRSEARNTGIKASRGEYIAFLDDDDIWFPNKLEKQVLILDSNLGLGLVHTSIELIDEQGHQLPKATEKGLRLYQRALRIGYTYEGISRLCTMFLSTVMVRRECLEKVGLFDPGIPAFEDWDLYLRIALEYRVGIVAEPLVRFRIHRSHTSMNEFIEGRIRTATKHLTMLNSVHNFRFRDKACHNFYIHLANAYYIATNLEKCRKYTLEALKLNPLVLFRWPLGIHLLMTMLPPSLIRSIHQLKRTQN